MTFFTSAALQMGPWSVSKAKTGVQCPWKFQRQYVEKTVVPPDKMPDISDTNLRVGSAVHKYAEEVAKGTPAEEAEEIGIEEGRLLSDEESVYQGMLENVKDFERRIDAFKTKYNVTADYVEKKFGVSSELMPEDFFSRNVFLRGVMDRTLIIQNSQAVIIDIKTGSYPSLRYSQEQLDAYSLMALQTWPHLKAVQSALYFVPAGKLLWAEKVKRSDFECLSQHPTIKYINTAAETALTDEIVPGKYCSWCQYKVLCLAERKVRRAEKRKKKASG